MKFILLSLAVILALLQYKIWLGDGGIPEMIKLQEAVSQAQLNVDNLKERNHALEAEVQDLKTGLDAIEGRARSELGMIGEGEVYYQVINNGTMKSK